MMSRVGISYRFLAQQTYNAIRLHAVDKWATLAEIREQMTGDHRLTDEDWGVLRGEIDDMLFIVDTTFSGVRHG